MQIVLLVVLFIALLWGGSWLVNLLFNGAAGSVDRALHERDRRRRKDSGEGA